MRQNEITFTQCFCRASRPQSCPPDLSLPLIMILTMNATRRFKKKTHPCHVLRMVGHARLHGCLCILNDLLCSWHKPRVRRPDYPVYDVLATHTCCYLKKMSIISPRWRSFWQIGMCGTRCGTQCCGSVFLNLPTNRTCSIRRCCMFIFPCVTCFHCLLETSTGGRRGPCSGCQTHTQQSADIASLTSRSTRLCSHATHLQTRRGSTLKSLTPEDRTLQAHRLRQNKFYNFTSCSNLSAPLFHTARLLSVHFLRHHDPSVPSRPYEHSVIQCNRVTNRVLVHPNMSTSPSCMSQRMSETEKKCG